MSETLHYFVLVIRCGELALTLIGTGLAAWAIRVYMQFNLRQSADRRRKGWRIRGGLLAVAVGGMCARFYAHAMAVIGGVGAEVTPSMVVAWVSGGLLLEGVVIVVCLWHGIEVRHAERAMA